MVDAYVHVDSGSYMDCPGKCMPNRLYFDDETLINILNIKCIMSD